MVDEVDMEKTLRSVREAYRFLHEFQKRLSDTIERFRQEFEGCIYYGSKPIFTDVASFRKNPHDHWTLDLFPTFAYSMQYKDYKPEKGKYSALLQISFYADRMYDWEEDKMPAEDENSKSTLEVYYWVTSKPLGDNFEWPKSWDWRGNEYELGKVFKHNKDLKVIGVALDFEKLKDEEGIKGEADRVKEEIIKKFKEENEDIKIYL